MLPNIHEKAIKMEHFANLVAIAYADNFLDDIEKDFLSERAKEVGLNTDEVKSLLENAEELKIVVPLNQEEIEEQIADAVYMAMVDGDISEKEYDLCYKIAQRLDFSKKELNQMIDLIKKLWKDQPAKQKT